jgi:hypothetical protein
VEPPHGPLASQVVLATLRDAAQKQALMTAIASHSMLSWAHVNLLGEYDFSDERLRDSFGLRLSQAAV